MSSSARSDLPTPSATLIDAMIGAFEESAELLRRLSDGQLRDAQSVPGASPAGAHYRHQIEHGRQLLAGLERGVVEYDGRARDTSLETSREQLLAAQEKLLDAIERLRAADMGAPLKVVHVLDGRGSQATFQSSLGRELMFVCAHTVHHNAIVALLLRTRGHDVPMTLGVMPSTTFARSRKRA